MKRHGSVPPEGIEPSTPELALGPGASGKGRSARPRPPQPPPGALDHGLDRDEGLRGSRYAHLRGLPGPHDLDQEVGPGVGPRVNPQVQARPATLGGDLGALTSVSGGVRSSARHRWSVSLRLSLHRSSSRSALVNVVTRGTGTRRHGPSRRRRDRASFASSRYRPRPRWISCRGRSPTPDR